MSTITETLRERCTVLAWVRTGWGRMPCECLVEITQEVVSGEENEVRLLRSMGMFGGRSYVHVDGVGPNTQ